MHIILALLTWAIACLYRVTFIVLGLFLQPLAIKFAKKDLNSHVLFTQYPEHGYWYHVTAPKWLYPWGNARDGFLGDKRGWWANERKGKHESFWSKYLWSAIRNPCNNLRFMKFSSVNVSKTTVELLGGFKEVTDEVGKDGWQFVRAVQDGIPYYGFKLMHQWGNSGRGLYVWIGYKIEPKHNEQYPDPIDDPFGKQMKGLTFRVNPYKDIS